MLGVQASGVMIELVEVMVLVEFPLAAGMT
jgi:hypothetical protein